MKLTLLIEGESSAELIAVLEKLEGGEPAAPAAPAKTGKGKAAKAAAETEEDPFAAGGGASDDDAPTHTIEDVMKAGTAYMKANGKNGKDKVLNILKKFGVKIVRDLKPEQFADAMEAFEV